MSSKIAMREEIKHPRSCLRCGILNPAGAIFCSRCGEKLRAIKVTNRREKKKIRLRSAESQEVEIRASDVITGFKINKICCGDCLDVMKQMPDEFVDLIVTSPPYNFGLDQYDEHKDTKSWNEYFDTLY